MAITDSTLPIPPQTTNNDGELKLNLEHLSRDEKPLDLDLSISIPTTEDKTDRLKQEDNLTKKATPQETPVTETPIVEPIQPEPTASPTTAELTGNQPETGNLEPSTPKIEPTITKPTTTDEPQLSLKDDMSIIKDLQNTENLIPVTPVKQGLMPETNTETPALNSQPTTLNLQPSTTEGVNSQPSTLNLDNILGETTPPSAILKTEVPVQPSTTPIANNKLPITNTKLPITSSKNKGVKIGLFAMLFVALGFTAFFIIKTMYPMGLLTNDQTTTTITEVDSGNQMAGDAISGDQISGEISNDTLLAAQTGDTSTTGHSSADDMFTDLSSALGSGDQTAVWLNQLTNYSQQGKQYFDQGKATNNKTMMKFGGYIWKKSDTFVNALESGVDLSNAMIPNYLAQFSGYLAQLQALENNALSTPTDIPTTDTQAQDNSLAPTE